MLNQPQHERRGLVAAQVVQDQQHPQGWQLIRQGERAGEPRLPAFPGCASLRLGLDWRLRQRRQDSGHLGLQPGVQHRVGGARDALDPDLPRGRVEQGQQLGRTVTDMLMRIAGRAGRRVPACSGLRDRLVGTSLVLGPGRQVGLDVRLLDQPLFTVASGSWTSTSPDLRRRFATPVWHHDRSRCQLRSASCSTHQMV